MLSNCLDGMTASVGSAFTGVMGGDASRKEVDLERDIERAIEAVDVLSLAVECLADESVVGVVVSKVFDVSAVRNRRIWSLRCNKSSRVSPSVSKSFDMGDTC